ncbi:MAG: hypothetical protein IFNCLDLE_02013 [Ignavibacteriaceae bacterium]|nr:hypothetical protein [Ignavibacteriaceae bacterium]
MGKPYKEEVDFLPQSISWALGQDVTLFNHVAKGHSARQLVVVGSGGSYTAASFLAQLHESSYGVLSRAITPLEYMAQQIQPRSNGALAFISAEGKNKDILAAADAALSTQSSSFLLTLTHNNPLGNICDTTGLATVIAYDMPWIKDGYLATNSLVAMMVLTARAYQPEEGNFNAIMPVIDDKWIANRRQQLRNKNVLQKLHLPRPIIILYGQAGRIAAVDLESKLAEASLAICQLCDYRQFAHGRHLQLASSEPPVIIAFTSPQDELLSQKTIELFPSHVSVLEINLPSGADTSEIIGVIDAILITEAVAEARGIDPGQPEVTKSGRDIYSLNISALLPKQLINNSPVISSKFGSAATSENSMYIESGMKFCAQLEKAKFKSIVCDFDGTFCDTARRFDGIDKKLVPQLERFLSAGIVIGFATGRGDSLHTSNTSLRKTINPALWPKVILGLYSGSFILPLDSPVPDSEKDARFQGLVEWLESTGLLRQLAAKPKIDGGQMGLRISNHSARTRTLAAILYWIRLTEKAGWRAYCSGHSIDVITEDTGKAKVVSFIAKLTDSDPQSEILRIGDSGDFDGNDFELLNEGLSLSVSSVSALPGVCWNLLPKECHGPIGTLYYLSSLEIVDGRASFTRSFIEQAKRLVSSNC